jgi:hypothetical protein
LLGFSSQPKSASHVGLTRARSLKDKQFVTAKPGKNDPGMRLMTPFDAISRFLTAKTKKIIFGPNRA